MITEHKIIFNNANNMKELKDNSVNLMITSPPYPMIYMWDEIFSKQNIKIKEALKENEGYLAFELMHKELDKVWSEVYRVLKEGGFACINIGDATRTINKQFQLYNSHSRILKKCIELGFKTFPSIIWNKQTNAPNKFMGSGMLPIGAYVTLEHEYILILRKGNRREYKSEEEKENRRESAFFWEERNKWFSDLWNGLKGTKQKLNNTELRKRSGAYPFELAYRLINMFTMKGDLVLDPFLGTATTTIASLCSERNSIGFEIDKKFSPLISERILDCKEDINEYIEKRINNHLDFVKEREKVKGELKYTNENHNFPIMTRQELGIKIRKLKSINKKDNVFITKYHTSDNLLISSFIS